MSQADGYTWHADYLCSGCFEKMQDSGELVECESCGDWTIPNDPHSGVGNASHPCATDHHALAFPYDTEITYPLTCGRCRELMDVDYQMEYFVGEPPIDAPLTEIYRSVVAWQLRTRDTRDRFEKAWDQWEESWGHRQDEGDTVSGFEEAVRRWQRQESSRAEKNLAALLDQVLAAAIAPLSN